MPLLATEADKLTLPSLQRGVIEVIITRGARELLLQLPFKRFEGDSYAFNREKTLPTDKSARDPYGTSIPGGVGTRERVAVASGMLARNADTAKIDVIGKSNINNQRANDIIMAAKALARDFVEQFISGMGDSYNLKGLEYWLDVYDTEFTEQKVFADDAGDGTGTAQNLSLNLLDDLLTRWKGEGFDVIYSDRETYVEVMDLLNAAGGNVAAMFMTDNYGQPFFAYRGTRWYVLDAVGAEKTATAGAWDLTGGASEKLVTVSEVADPYFVGFSDLDLGRSVTVDGTDVGVITAIIDERNVTTDGVAGDDTGAVVVAATHAIYACRFDEEDGVTAIYHSNRGVPQNAGKYYGPIAGFDAENIGLLESSPIYRTRIDWFGNYVQQSPYAVARLSHYALGGP